MTATTTVPRTANPVPTTAKPVEQSRPQVWKTGAGAGVAASVATSAFAGLMHAIDVPLKVSGRSIPVIGFAQLTLVASIIGTVLAVVFSRRSVRPRRMFLNTTIGLTLVSLVPDVLADAHTATRFALALSHLVAAAIVIPALASRLAVSRGSN